MSDLLQPVPLLTPINPVADFNVTQLGLISLQGRLPAKYRHRWEFGVEQYGSTASIKCYTDETFSVPHSMANEIFMGIALGLIIEGAQTADGTYVLHRVTIPQLLSYAGYRQKMTGRLYKEAHQALKDLAAARYVAEACWRAPTRDRQVMKSLIFSLIYKLEEELVQHPFNPTQNSHIFTIYIDKAIADSITGPLTLAINPKVIDRLVSPQARGLYRLLEAHRRDSNDPANASEHIRIGIPALKTMMRILSTKTAASALIYNLSAPNGPLEQLKNAGYLDSCDTTGRGDATMLHIQISQNHSLTDPRVLKKLNSLGVIGKNAQSLAATTTLQEVEKVEKMLEERLKAADKGGRPIRSASGLIVHLLRDGSVKDELQRERESERTRRRMIQVPTPEPEDTSATTAVQDTTQQALENLNFIYKVRLKKSRTALSEADKSAALHLTEEGRITPAEVRTWMEMPTDDIPAAIQARLAALS